MLDIGNVIAHRRVGAAAAVLAVAAAAGTVVAVGQSVPVKADTAVTAAARTPVRQHPGSFADVIARVSPAVVSVRVTGAAEASDEGDQGQYNQIPEPFRRFFGDQFAQRFFGIPNGRQPNQQQGGPRFRVPQTVSLGSGFIIDPTGYIVTNNHVVRGGGKIEVVIGKDDTYPAKLIGTDPKTDLALLKIDADKQLAFVRWGDSDKARVGDWVITVGSPFGLGHTATLGIVSARGRNIGEGPYDDFIQIDAPINRGNSGGPAFNAQGDVIGVNTAIYTPNGGSVGIGFSIPSAMAKDVIAQIKKTGSVERGWLGVQIQPVTKEIAESLNLKQAEGALVANVMAGGPASHSDLRQGDVILSVNGKKVKRYRDVPRMVAAAKPGETLSMTVWRKGKEQSLKLKVGKQTAAQVAEATPESVQGMKLSSLNKKARDQYDIGADVKGVLITAVRPNSTAWSKGLRRGDVIVDVGQTAVSQPADVAKQLKNARDAGRKAVLLLIHRRSDEQFVALPIRKA